MIESVLESVPWNTGSALTGTISTTAANSALVGVGTLFTTELTVDDLIFYTDANGLPRNGQISAIADNLNATLRTNAKVTTAGVAYRSVASAGQTIPFFEADSTAFKKPIILTSVNNDILKTSSLKSKISVNEGILVKSLYLRFPYQYTMSDTPITLVFAYYDNTGAFVGFISSIGEADGVLNIDRENGEIIINEYIAPLTDPLLTTGTWQIGVSIINGVTNYDDNESFNYTTPHVSMLDANVDIDGNLLPITIGMRILHANQPLGS
jgi:hypothetical protein